MEVWIRSSGVSAAAVAIGAGVGPAGVGPAVIPFVGTGAGGGAGVGIAPFSCGIRKNSSYCSRNATLFGGWGTAPGTGAGAGAGGAGRLCWVVGVVCSTSRRLIISILPYITNTTASEGRDREEGV
jgi:hypothetical protein